jgi:amicoumacin kinase
VKFEFKDEFTPDILVRGLAKYGIKSEDAKELGAYENIVWESGQIIIRFTHHTHRTLEWICAELEFMDYLFKNGARVVQPVLNKSREFVADLGQFYVTAFAKAKGARPSKETWVPAMWKNWGRQIGLMHRLAKDFNPVHKRYLWFENAYYANPSIDFPEAEIVIPKTKLLIEELKALPRTRDNWGVVHSDVHHGNFFVDEDLDINIFDFDDAMYMHFAQDIAMVMFYGLLVPSENRTEYAKRLYQTAMEGYCLENTLSEADLNTIPMFIELRRLTDILVTLAPKPRNLEDRNVKLGLMLVEQIKRGEPYIDIDFV